MFEKIKSKKFIKNLFQHIYNKRKLKLIKYNKKLQYIIDINLDHYKIFKGKYILYKGIKLWKEFNP